jgi:hypothetical protein
LRESRRGDAVAYGARRPLTTGVTHPDRVRAHAWADREDPLIGAWNRL